MLGGCTVLDAPYKGLQSTCVKNVIHLYLEPLPVPLNCVVASLWELKNAPLPYNWPVSSVSPHLTLASDIR